VFLDLEFRENSENAVGKVVEYFRLKCGNIAAWTAGLREMLITLRMAEEKASYFIFSHTRKRA
jgi:hypothetical protein